MCTAEQSPLSPRDFPWVVPLSRTGRRLPQKRKSAEPAGEKPDERETRRLRYLGVTTIDENPSRVSCTAAGAASYFTYYNDFVAFISAQQQRLAIKHAGECLSQRAPLSVIATRCIN